MAVYIFTGKLGGGKTLCAVGRIKEKILSGCRVATNIDIDLSKMFHPKAKNIQLLRIPDKPKIEDFKAIGIGNESYDESENGLIVLDECGTWFNARNWNDKDRKPVNEWFLHARKFGWDVILIIQDIELLDSQARRALAEHTAFCKRLDRLQIPFIGFLYKLITGYRITLPRVHVAKCVYGTSPKDLVSDRWVFRGSALYDSYDTKQAFLEDYPYQTHSVLPPWLTIGRYKKPLTIGQIMRLTHIYFKRLKSPLALGLGAFLGVLVGMIAIPVISEPQSNDQPVVEQASPPAIVEDLPVETVKTAESDVEDEIVTTQEQFEGFEIVGFIENKERKVYIVDHPTHGKFTNFQLESLGYIVFPVNECELMLFEPDTPADKAIIFDHGCVSRSVDAQRKWAPSFTFK